MRHCALLASLAVLAPARLAGQLSVEGGVSIGRAEHRILDAGTLIRTSGTLFGGSVGLRIGTRIEIRAEALGGRLATDGGSSIDDHEIAQLQLVAGMQLRPWLTLQAGPAVRNYFNSLGRQHWTGAFVGAEARVPLAFDHVRGILQGRWIPVVSVTGLSSPDIALAAGAGLEWRTRRVGVRTLYQMERYDFHGPSGATRPEDLSTFCIVLSVFPLRN